MELARLRRALLTRLFNLLYRTGNVVYDPLVSVFFGPAWHRWRRTILPFVEYGNTLEIGCGTGQLLADLSRRSSMVIGLDISGPMLGPAKRRATEAGAAVVAGDAMALPFRDETFTSIVSTFPAGFITQRRTLDEAARVLKPGGCFLVVVSAEFRRFQWRRPFIHPILRVAYGSGMSMRRWRDEMLAHPELPGEWQDLPTNEGAAFVWVARKLPRREDVISDSKLESG